MIWDWSGLRMKCKEVINCLEKIAPCCFAEKWDNVGLIAGREDKEINKILIALDPTSEVIEEAVSWGADLLITHHPLIFSGIKSVTTNDFIGKRVFHLIYNDICYYAMHTNFDVMGMADAVADELKLEKSQVLDVTFQDEISKEGIGRLGELSRTMSLEECARFVKERCKLSSVKVFGDPEKLIDVVALIPGSGKSYIDMAISKGAQVIITGDIDHHNGLDAVERGLAVIDAGHYGLEKIFVAYMEEVCKRELTDIQIKRAIEKEPYWTVV